MSKTARSLLRVWLPLAATLALASSAVYLGQNTQFPNARPSGTDNAANPLRVTTSVAVWADIAAEIGGNRVAATAIVGKAGQDPHSYVATARDQLAVNQAAVTIANGLDYDAFFTTLTSASPAKPHGSNLVIGCLQGCNQNPHVWYSLSQVAQAVPKIGKAIGASASQVANYGQGVAKLESKVRSVRALTKGKSYLLTESFASYLLQDLGMTDATPVGFKTAVENEQDASPLVMKGIHDLLKLHKVSVLVTNAQTSNPQTLQLTSWAKAAGVPVLSWSELLPAHQSYLSWMSANLSDIEGVLK
jgi:zinc/manganese transport system substrate-binding protein